MLARGWELLRYVCALLQQQCYECADKEPRPGRLHVLHGLS